MHQNENAITTPHGKWQLLMNRVRELMRSRRNRVVLGIVVACLAWQTAQNAGTWMRAVELRMYEAPADWKPLAIADPCERLAIGHGNVFVIDQEGAVYSWGTHGKGQLGYPPANPQRTNRIPGKVPLPGPAKCIATGNDYVVTLLEDGSIWHWGDFGPGYTRKEGNPHRLLAPKKFLDATNAVAVTAHWRGGVYLTSDGQVFEWGASPTGSTSHRDGPYRWTPVEVEFPAPIRWIRSRGGSHVGISREGVVFRWGWLRGFNSEGDSRAHHPHPVRFPLDHFVVSVADTGNSLHFLTDQGRVWIVGKDIRDFSEWKPAKYLPTPVPVEHVEAITSLDSGPLRSISAVRTDGALIVWGKEFWKAPALAGGSFVPPALARMPFAVRRVYTSSEARFVEDRGGCFWATQWYASRLRLDSPDHVTPAGLNAEELERWESRYRDIEFPRKRWLRRSADYYRWPVYRPDGSQICNPAS